jgi:hypothetical protein
MREQGKYAMTDRTEYKDSHEKGRRIDSIKIAKTAKRGIPSVHLSNCIIDYDQIRERCEKGEIE